MSAGEVEDYLLQSGQPLTITVDDEEDQVITPANAFMQLAGEVNRLQEEITSTREQLSAAHEQISELQKQQTTDSEQQKESIDVRSEERRVGKESGAEWGRRESSARTA